MIKYRCIYLTSDMAGQKRGTKLQVSNITEQNRVTTERRLLERQEVESTLVWKQAKKQKLYSDV